MTAREDGGQSSRMNWLYWAVLISTVILIGWALRAAAPIVVPTLVAFFLTIVLAPLDYGIRKSLPSGTKWLGHLASMLLILLILAIFAVGIYLAARQVIQRFPQNIGSPSELLTPDRTSPDEEGLGLVEAIRKQALPPSAGEEGQPPQDGAGADGTDRQPSPQDGAQREGASTQPDSKGQGQSSEGQQGGGVFETLKSYKDELVAYLRQQGTGFAATIISRTAAFLSSLTLVLFLALFLLIEMPHWNKKLHKVLEDRREAGWIRAVEATAANLRWFLVVKTVLGLATGAMYAGWLWIMGVDLVLTWGVVTFLLSYIPVLGSLIAGILAGGYAFFQLDFGQAVIVGLGLLAIEQLMGNFIEPRFLGRQLALSSFAVLLSLLIWGWMWGAVGALLATPILIFVVSIAAQFERLRPVAILLSEDGEESVQRMHAKAG